VARGTQHRKRRPRPNARAAAVAAPAKTHRHKPPQWQEELFFQRLRNHAKWIYVALAVAFAGTFVLLGVGSGSTGISSALQNLFSSTSSGGASISGLQHKTEQHPNDAANWRKLATALETKHRTADAINALERYSTLKPKDAGALTELAGQYTQRALDLQTQVQTAQQASQSANPEATFVPPATTPLGQVFASPSGLQSPITNVVSQSVGSQATALYQQYQQVISQREGAYKRVAILTPSDPTAQISLGQAALAAQDTTTAVEAFKKFLKLAPQDPEAAYARNALKQLAPAKKK
jgi:cytochrome c-type biogenesis protein CcmH/NrfG